MKPTSPETKTFESTYALLTRSEEKPRGLFEAVAYLALVVSTVAALLQFGEQVLTPPASLHSAAATAVNTLSV